MAKRRINHRRRKKGKTTLFKNLNNSRLLGIIVCVIIFVLFASHFINLSMFMPYSQNGVNRERQAFINKILPSAQTVQSKYKILTSITLGQAILESDWGQSELASKYNNLFGVKAGPQQKGVTLSTTEYVNGKAQKVTGRFRVYDDWDQSIEAHARLLALGTDWNNFQYKDVIQADNYKDSAIALSTDGYATDPVYAQKVIQIIQKYHLNKYDKRTE